MGRIVTHCGVFLAIALLSAMPAYGALVPCGNDSPVTCNWDSVITFANTLLNFMIALGVTIGSVLLAIAGIKLILARGNPSAWSDAKKTLWNIVIGIAIMILAFTVIRVLLTTLGVSNNFRAGGLRG